MKVLHVIDALGVGGGAEHSLAQMVPLMADHGVESDVMVLAPRKTGLEHELRAQGFQVTNAGGPGIVQSVKNVRAALRSGNYDLVHVSLYNASIVVRIAAIGVSIPVVNSFVNTSYDPVRTAALNVAPWKLRLVRIADRLTARRVDHAHAITAAAAQEANVVLNVAKDKISIVPRGRSAETLGERNDERRNRVRNDLGIAADELVVLNVGRQDAQKAHVDLIEAFALVRETVPPARLLIAGRSGDASDQIRATINRLDLGDTVTLLGNRDDVADLICACDVFAFPSQYEGLGCALIEAMALGAPIVGSDAPAIVEVLQHGEVGVVVQRGDVAELATQLINLLNSPDERARLSARGQREFDESYRLEQVVTDMVGIYQKVVDEVQRR